MKREDKKTFVSEFKATVQESSILLAAHYSGLSVNSMEQLRRTASAEGVTVRVTKNRLVRLALEGTSFEGISSLLKGPVIMIYGKEVVSGAKVAWNFSKENEKFEVLGAFVDGNLLALNEVKVLASLPSLDELRGKLVGLLQAPAQKVASVAQAPAGQLARVFNAYAQKS